MRVVLFVTVVLFISAQVTAQNAHYNDELSDAKNDFDLLDLTNTYEDNNSLRNLNDLKNKIKKSILAAWDKFKAIAKNANAKIKALAEKVKEKINKATKAFTESLDKLKKEFDSIVTKITATGQKLKACLKEHKNSIENIFKEIITNVKKCVSNNVITISNIDISHVLLSTDDTIFLATVQNKLSTTCTEDNEKCLSDMHHKVIGEIENATKNISQKYIDARNVIEDRLDNTLTCITEGLTIAAKTIVNETIEIIQCVKNKGL